MQTLVLIWLALCAGIFLGRWEIYRDREDVSILTGLEHGNRWRAALSFLLWFPTLPFRLGS